MRVVVTGGTGQLGRELRAAVPERVDLHALDRSRLDLLDPDGGRRLLRELEPEVVINAAARTDVDRAEDDEAATFAVNAAGAGWLAAATAELGGRFIQISTDYVFDGERGWPYEPERAPAPRSVYGASKLAGEERVLEAAGDRALIVRTGWLYSRYRANFVMSVLRRMAAGEEIAMVYDQLGSPTWAGGLAGAIWRACELPRLEGILHWTDAGVVSRYDLAVAVGEEGLARGLLEREVAIRPIRTGEYPVRAARPACSALDCRSAEQALGLQRVHWRRSLRKMLDEVVRGRDS